MELRVKHPIIIKSNIKLIHESSTHRPISIMPIIVKILVACIAEITDHKYGFTRKSAWIYQKWRLWQVTIFV